MKLFRRAASRLVVVLGVVVVAAVVVPALPAAAQSATCSGEVTAVTGPLATAEGTCDIEDGPFNIVVKTINLKTGFFSDPVATAEADCLVLAEQLVSCTGETTIAGVPIGTATWVPVP